MLLRYLRKSVSLGRLHGCCIVSTGFQYGFKDNWVCPIFIFQLHRKEGKTQDSLTHIKYCTVACRKRRPTKGLLWFVITIYFSLKLKSLILNCISISATGASNCPLANITWYLGEGPSFNLPSGASNQILRISVSGMAANRAPVSMSLLNFNSPKSIRNHSTLCSFLMAILLTVGETLRVRLVLLGAVVKFGRQGLHFVFVELMVSTEKSVPVMYQVSVDLLSTSLLMHIVVRLIHVHL